MWWIYAILSAVFAALTAILAKVGLKDVDSDLATAIRTFIILIMTAAILVFKGSKISIGTMTKSNMIFLVLSGIATGLSWLFYFRALQLGKVSQVAPVDKLSLALTILLSFVFLNETITLKIFLGVAFIIAGVLLVIF